jgi:hypothetical protein
MTALLIIGTCLLGYVLLRAAKNNFNFEPVRIPVKRQDGINNLK